MERIEITLEHGDHLRLGKLHERVLEAVAASGIDADVHKGTATGGMAVHGAPELAVGGRHVACPDAMTVEGLTKLFTMAATESPTTSSEPLTLPFASRFRVTGSKAEAAGAEVDEVVDDATGVRYLLAGGSLTPLLNADGTPQRAR